MRMTARTAAALLAAGHTADDICQGAVPALVPFLVTSRHYSYTAASGITLAATLLSSVAQPLFGALADRRSRPWLAPAGMAVAGIGIGLSGLADSYPLTWLAIALSGLGVAAYHPEAARLARHATAGSNVGMSWFFLGGNVGFFLGPIIVTPLLGAYGLGGTPLLALPAVAGGLVTAAVLRSVLAVGSNPERRAASVDRGADGPPVRDDWVGFGRLVVVVAGRSIVFFGLSTFLAVFVAQRLHAGHAAGETALALLFGAGAAGTLLGGRLADRYGRIRTIRASYACTVPALIGLVTVSGPAIYVFVAAIGIAIYVPFSIQVTLGQDYLPNRIGTASGVTIGLAVSIGGVVTPALGALADASSLRTALAVLIALPAIEWWTAGRMREPTDLPPIARPATAPGP